MNKEDQAIVQKHYENQARKLGSKQGFPMASGDIYIIKSRQDELEGKILILQEDLKDMKSAVVPAIQIRDTWIHALIGLVFILLLALLQNKIKLHWPAWLKKRKKQ